MTAHIIADPSAESGTRPQRFSTLRETRRTPAPSITIVRHGSLSISRQRAERARSWTCRTTESATPAEAAIYGWSPAATFWSQPSGSMPDRLRNQRKRRQIELGWRGTDRELLQFQGGVRGDDDADTRNASRYFDRHTGTRDARCAEGCHRQRQRGHPRTGRNRSGRRSLRRRLRGIE